MKIVSTLWNPWKGLRDPLHGPLDHTLRTVAIDSEWTFWVSEEVVWLSKPVDTTQYKNIK